ncbi:NAD(P)-binding protein [Xylariaceae sp. FL1651]|nr:NAD(P)-binding protein [Xylariaceae sp. FL1651]
MSSSKIFITGTTGFIGSHVAGVALKAGHHVRLSIRKTEQQSGLEKLFAPYLAQVEFVVVPDITNTDRLREVLAGIDHVWHIASPLPGAGPDIRSDYVEPAVRGTIAVLEAAHTHKTVKKVVVMSSILSLTPMDVSYGQDLLVTGNTGDVISVDLDMSFSDGFKGRFEKYHASKILAHQAYRDWVKQHQPGFVTISLHPTFVAGPDLVQDKAEDIRGVNSLLWSALHSEQASVPAVFVDVRDVAIAFIRALEENIRTGSEYILSTHPFTWQDVVDFVKARYPALELKLAPPFNIFMAVDNKPAEHDLKMSWRPMETLVSSVIDQQLALRG